MSLTARGIAVELLRCQPEVDRARRFLMALDNASGTAGLTLTQTTEYLGASPWLVLWGPGAPERRAVMQRHVAAGGRAIALDLAYWARETKVRVSIDAAHPQAWVMRRSRSHHRFDQDPAPVLNTWKPTGPILIAGIGRKAQVQYGAATVDAWEAAMQTRCAQRWPGRRIIRRPKPLGPPEPADQVMRGCSLVITWHSNMAIDAIRNGIPVVCRDGAAAAVCPSELPEDPQPLSAVVRDQFLWNLAWFQWAPHEVIPMWRWLQELLA